MPYTLQSFLLVSAVLFCLGLYTILTRSNAIGILMGIELVLNAAGVNFVAFARFLPRSLAAEPVSGQVFTLFVITVAAAEVAVALAIVLGIYSGSKTIEVTEFKELKA